ncbi:MAG: trimethylamine methyltransferase family protein [Candidatus Paceibacterota bacterium]
MIIRMWVSLVKWSVLILVKPGTPVWMGACGIPMDMEEEGVALGSVEATLICAANSQLANYYEIPSRGIGGATDSRILNLQTGFEKTMTLLLNVLARDNVIFYLESIVTP